MWYPNKTQWRVIWIAAILATLFLSGGTGSFVVFGLCIVGLGALLVWMLQKHEPKELVDCCGKCGREVHPDWKHCPACGEVIED